MPRSVEQSMSLVRIAGLLVALLAAGCTGLNRMSQNERAWGSTMQEQEAPWLQAQPPVEQREKPVAVPVQAAAKPEPPAVKPAAPAVKPEVPIAAMPATPAPPATAAPSQSAAKPETPAVKPPVKAPAVAAPPKESAAPPAPKPAAPTLDLASLEKRLKETNAIGVFTKLTLKNQVDALLEQFRAYYQGRTKTTLAALRQPYDQLLLKVLSLLQDSDPPLARAIVESREAIWGILSDPDKFKNL